MDTEELFEILQSCDVDQMKMIKSVAHDLELEHIEERICQLISLKRE
ncbi:hypothetical protein [Paenibacillus amylolyticus]|jgi:hypothetical protein|nr:hypothetical protein [Paenibacillus amylolyticus]